MVGIKILWDKIKDSTLYEKRVVLEKIFTGIGIVLFFYSLFDFNLTALIKIVIGIVIGSLISVKVTEEEAIKKVLLKEQIISEEKRKRQEEKNEEIKLWITGSKDMNELILSIVSLGVIITRLSHFEKLEEKMNVIKEFVKEIENFYEFKEQTKARITEIMKSEPDLFEVTKNLRELEISDYVENKISDFLWQIVLENGYLGIEEEKLLHSWSLYVKTNITE